MCGIFGILGHPNAAQIAFMGIHGLQHRGQESAGIAVVRNGQIQTELGMGQAGEVFSPERLARLEGADTAIGHVRYSTAGSSFIRNAQPITATTGKGSVAVVHNGNLVNAADLRRRLVDAGAILQGNSDTEMILHLLAKSPCLTMSDAILDALTQVRGAYCLLFLFDRGILAVRDPQGFRPLFFGTLDGRTCFASESAALDLVGATGIQEMEPGEVVVATPGSVESIQWRTREPRRFCIFEYVYFARPDSAFSGIPVAQARTRMGEALAREYPVRADVVVPVPDSGLFAAMGYAKASGIPFQPGLIRSHYIGRTFIQPSPHMRSFGVRLKLAPVRTLLEGKDVVLVDDSIVRGTTMKQIVGLLKQAGVRSVHVRISCPPTKYPCYYGIDTPDPKELIANNLTLDQIRDFIGADSIGYLSRRGMIDAVDGGSWFCTACWDGDYPVPLEDTRQQQLFALKSEGPQ
jgi:amidophosphoribosyltransferase